MNVEFRFTRFNDETLEIPFVDYLSALFANLLPDLIVSVGAPAAGIVQRHRTQLFGGIPMVFTGIEPRRIRFTELTQNDTVVAAAIDLPALIENILRLLPDTNNVAVVNGAFPINAYHINGSDQRAG